MVNWIGSTISPYTIYPLKRNHTHCKVLDKLKLNRLSKKDKKSTDWFPWFIYTHLFLYIWTLIESCVLTALNINSLLVLIRSDRQWLSAFIKKNLLFMRMRILCYDLWYHISCDFHTIWFFYKLDLIFIVKEVIEIVWNNTILWYNNL